jgi:hypothetical protein
VYLGSSGSTAITSDETMKDIWEIDPRYEDFFMRLHPVLYKYRRTGHRTHIGYGAREVEEALTELCREFDIPRPLWLNKHYREFEEFRRTQFLPEHFMEDVSFQRLDIEFLEDDGKTRKSNDPRNQFDGF